MLRWPLIVLSTLGVVCAVASLFGYSSSAYAVGAPGQKAEPRGFERVTRHGFMVALAMTALAHSLLATHLTGTVFFAALAIFPVLGSMHQDAGLRARNPELHGAFVARTSLIPFAAILSGCNRLVLSELRPAAFAVGLLAAFALRQVHPYIFADGGIHAFAAVLAGASVVAAEDAIGQWNRRQQ